MKMTIVGLSSKTKNIRVVTDHKMEPDLIERDNERYVTIYGPEDKDGLSYYVILDQEVIDKLKTI